MRVSGTAIVTIIIYGTANGERSQLGGIVMVVDL